MDFSTAAFVGECFACWHNKGDWRAAHRHRLTEDGYHGYTGWTYYEDNAKLTKSNKGMLEREQRAWNSLSLGSTSC